MITDTREYMDFVPVDTQFMRFWSTTNQILRSREQPEMLYSEARSWWNQTYKDQPFDLGGTGTRLAGHVQR